MRRLNAITEKLEALDFASAPGYVINGLKREELVALNSTLLHELYFASLGGDGTRPTPAMREALARDFGSFDRWRDEFLAMGYALGGGSGWVLLTYVPRDGRLMNQYAAEHTQAVASGVPVLALDMYEHAYHIDFGANAKAYADAFLRNVDWSARRGPLRGCDQGRTAAPAGAGGVQRPAGRGRRGREGDARRRQAVQLIDARPRHFVSRQADIADGATWRDPERLQDWIGELSKEKPVVVYCAYGFHVGCRTAMALREAGFDAKYMTGGHSGWKAMGGPIKLA